jgi:hypothetical protein
MVKEEFCRGGAPFLTVGWGVSPQAGRACCAYRCDFRGDSGSGRLALTSIPSLWLSVVFKDPLGLVRWLWAFCVLLFRGFLDASSTHVCTGLLTFWAVLDCCWHAV